MSGGLVSIGVAVRKAEGNRWLERLVASLREHRTGVGAVPVMVEEAEYLTKVEKKNRLVEACGTRYLCVIEDDAFVCYDGWLGALLGALNARPPAGLAGPLEAKREAGDEEIQAAAEGAHCEVRDCSNLGGFCQALDLERCPRWDPRVQTMDDLWMCLAVRARGLRVVQAAGAILRHTKEPWARDTTPPWAQPDRSRFGEGDAYYERDRHAARRLAEARILVCEFGDMARQALPPELLATLEPGPPPEGQGRPGCSGCHRQIPLDECYYMDPDVGPLCEACAPAKRGKEGAE